MALLLLFLGRWRRCRRRFHCLNRLAEIGLCRRESWRACENAVAGARELNGVFVRTHSDLSDVVRRRGVGFESAWACSLDQ